VYQNISKYERLINSNDDVTIKNNTTVITWPVIPAAVTKHTVNGSYR